MPVAVVFDLLHRLVVDEGGLDEVHKGLNCWVRRWLPQGRRQLHTVVVGLGVVAVGEVRLQVELLFEPLQGLGKISPVGFVRVHDEFAAERQEGLHESWRMREIWRKMHVN